MQPRHLTEAAQASDELAREKKALAATQSYLTLPATSLDSPTLWISSSPASQALLLAEKKENRFNKDKVFNGFVLERNSNAIEDNEFLQFIALLASNIDNIPSGTRISLAIANTFMDTSDLVDYTTAARARMLENIRGGYRPYHWNNVELLIKDKQVYSFTLDAADSVGYRKIHENLKATFPDGDHFVFKADKVTLAGEEKVRQIQYAGIGCRVFCINLLKQLSQIDSHQLFLQELPKLATLNIGHLPYGSINPENFEGGEKLLRIFRGMQSWSRYEPFPEAVKQTRVKDNNDQTLDDLVKQGFAKGPKGPNYTIFRKNVRYMADKAKYFAKIGPETTQRIMKHRQGFVFLANPILFELTAALAKSNNETGRLFIKQLATALASGFTSDHADHLKMRSLASQLSELTESKTTEKGNTDHQLVLYLADGLEALHDNDPAKKQLIDIIKGSMPLLLKKKTEVVVADTKEMPSYYVELAADMINKMKSIMPEFKISPPDQKNLIDYLENEIRTEGPKHFIIDCFSATKNVTEDNLILAIFAFRAKQSAILLDLIKHNKIDPNVILGEGDEGATLLHLSVYLGLSDVIKALLEKNATLTENPDGQTPLEFAFSQTLNALDLSEEEFTVKLNVIDALLPVLRIKDKHFLKEILTIDPNNVGPEPATSQMLANFDKVKSRVNMMLASLSTHAKATKTTLPESPSTPVTPAETPDTDSPSTPFSATSPTSTSSTSSPRLFKQPSNDPLYQADQTPDTLRSDAHKRKGH